MADSALHKLVRRASLAVAHVRSPVLLRGVTSLGARPRVDGGAHVENRGTISIGDDFHLVSRPVQSHLVAGPGGEITIGDRVSIGAGAAIASEAKVTIESDVKIGPFAMLLDTDFHGASDFHAKSETAPIVIEEGARLDRNVTVLKGARIGRGAWIAAGSVVSGEIAPGAYARGVPAREVKDRPKHAAGPTRDAAEVTERVKAVVSETFNVGRPVELPDGPADIRAWDSLGTLRLLLAIEDELGLLLADNALYGVKSVGDVVDVVLRAIEA